MLYCRIKGLKMLLSSGKFVDVRKYDSVKDLTNIKSVRGHNLIWPSFFLGNH